MEYKGEGMAGGLEIEREIVVVPMLKKGGREDKKL